MAVLRDDGLAARRQAVLDRIGGDALYTFIEQIGYKTVRNGRERAILCPFHGDTKPSMYINPTKADAGIFKCFACGASHDVFSFVQHTRGLNGFVEALNWVAREVGVLVDGKEQAAAVAPEQNAVQRRPTASQMTPGEIYAVYKQLKAAAIDPSETAASFGVDPRAIVKCEGIVVRTRRNRETGCYEPGDGALVICQPMRNPTGVLLSLRFCAVVKRAGERRKKWSLDQTAPGDPDTQLKHTVSGLMATPYTFAEPPRSDQFTFEVEGETDLYAGNTMLLKFGEDESKWPARFIGIPGVQSCHEMLVPSLVGQYACTFMDGDQAGREAVFDRPPLTCDLCGRTAMRENCGQRNKDGSKCPGRGLLNTKEKWAPGLVGKQQEQGIKAMAAFPPANPNSTDKQDLRDLVKAGWDFDRFFSHVMDTATRTRRMR